MDSQLLQLIARLKIALRRDSGFSLNTERFFSDNEYAKEALIHAEESENIDLVTLALQLSQKLGFISEGPTTQTLINGASTLPKLAPKKYAFGARS